jgi:hypothetical protein
MKTEIRSADNRRAAAGSNADPDEDKRAATHHHANVLGLAGATINGVGDGGAHGVSGAGDGVPAVKALEENADAGDDKNDGEDSFHE